MAAGHLAAHFSAFFGSWPVSHSVAGQPSRNCVVTTVTNLPGQVSRAIVYVPWVSRIAHTSLTPGHPETATSQEGSLAKEIYVYGPISCPNCSLFLNRSFL